MVRETECMDRVTITLDRKLIDKIIAFNCLNRQTYIDWTKTSDLVFGIEERLYDILHDAHEMVETAKRELESYFTDDEALLLFVCLSDEELGWEYWDKPERDVRNLIQNKIDRLHKFYDDEIPMDVVRRVFQKATYLTSSRCNALIKMSHDMRHMTKSDTLRFSTNDIAHCFRTSGSLTAEKWYEIEIH